MAQAFFPLFGNVVELWCSLSWCMVPHRAIGIIISWCRMSHVTWCHLGPWIVLSHDIACIWIVGATLGHVIYVEWNQKGDAQTENRTPIYWTRAESFNLSAIEALMSALDFRWLVFWAVFWLKGLCLLFLFSRPWLEDLIWISASMWSCCHGHHRLPIASGFSHSLSMAHGITWDALFMGEATW